ncbi:hypothetical protein ACLB2K_072936 [Fragaria x ananassa]
MAMRQRVGAANTSRPRQSIRPTYEDFQPHFELKEEPEAHIIYVQLPGFLKEQVRITFVYAPGVIRVHGQRPLGNNRWSRFNQTFPLPQNCHESKIYGKISSSGVLTITLPKEVPKADPNKEAAATKPIQDAKPKEKDQIHAPPSQKPTVQPKVQKGQDATHQTAIATAAKDPQVAASEPEAQKGPQLKQGIAETQDHKIKEAGVEQNVVSAMTQTEKHSDEKRVIALSNTANQPKPQKAGDEIPPKTMADQKAKADYQNEVQDRYITDANEKPGEPKNTEKAVDTPLSKEKEMTGERSSVASVIDRIAPNTLDQVKKTSKRLGSVEQEKPEDAAKQRMKNQDKWINNEEKQLLINVGAAVLVLVAFGAYMTYSLRCSGKPKN